MKLFVIFVSLRSAAVEVLRTNASLKFKVPILAFEFSPFPATKRADSFQRVSD